MQQTFTAILDIIGINPFVFIPEQVLSDIFEQAGKNKGSVPVKGTVNEKKFTQTLVKYKGHWRLYINTVMLPDSPKHIGETLTISLCYDPKDRTLSCPPALIEVLKENPDAEKAFNHLSKSRQQEIIRYLTHLKTETALRRNIMRILGFLKGKESFAGRNLKT